MGSDASSPAAGCGLTSVMAAICHFDVDWQSAGNVSRHKPITAISLRMIHSSHLFLLLRNQSPETNCSLSEELLLAKFDGNRHAKRWKSEASVPARLEFHAFA